MSCPPASRLLRIPERYHTRYRQHARQVFAPCGRLHPLPEPDVRHEIPGILLQFTGNLLLFLQTARNRPLVAQLLVLRIRWPAEPGLLTGGRVAGQRDRIADGITVRPGDEQVPAALIRRGFKGTTVDVAYPIRVRDLLVGAVRSQSDRRM